MKRRTLTLFFGVLVVFSSAVLIRCGSDSETTVEDSYDATSTPPDELCLVKPSWFPHSQTPAPAEGKGSPFDDTSTTNQIFHQWSWNKFLWLTKPDKGGNPLFLNQDLVKQVSSQMDLITVPSGTLVTLEDTAQAGSGSPQLHTNPNYNNGKSEIVYYSIHMNKRMYSTGIAFGEAIAKKKIPTSNQEVFPVGSFELKVAWVPADAIPSSKIGSYYTTTASLSRDGGKTFQPTKVALIGMHVVGVVQNHPEFIWATFEHEDLAPNYDWKANSASSSDEKLLFKKGKVSGIDGIRYDKTTKMGIIPYQVFDLFQYGVPRNSDGSYMTTAQSEPENYDNIKGINQCVKSHLKDVWANYFYNGSIWLNMDGKNLQEQTELIVSLKGNIGDATKGSPARGSMNCANVTMESFTQTFQQDIKSIAASNLANCFSCHTSTSFSDNNAFSPLYLSHSFQGYLLRKQGNSESKVESIKSKEEERILPLLRQ